LATSSQLSRPPKRGDAGPRSGRFSGRGGGAFGFSRLIFHGACRPHLPEGIIIAGLPQRGHRVRFHSPTDKPDALSGRSPADQRDSRPGLHKRCRCCSPCAFERTLVRGGAGAGFGGPTHRGLRVGHGPGLGACTRPWGGSWVSARADFKRRLTGRDVSRTGGRGDLRSSRSTVAMVAPPTGPLCVLHQPTEETCARSGASFYRAPAP